MQDYKFGPFTDFAPLVEVLKEDDTKYPTYSLRVHHGTQTMNHSFSETDESLTNYTVANIHPLTEQNAIFKACNNKDYHIFDRYFAPYFSKIKDYMRLHEYDKKYEWTHAPIWWNGKFKAVTETHFDEFLNCLIVLRGHKTIYCAHPQSIIVRHQSNHASAFIPDTLCLPGKKPVPMKRYDVAPGEMLIIPEGWWHYIISDPQTVMVNFWFEMSA